MGNVHNITVRGCSYAEVEHFDTPLARRETAHVYEGKTKHDWFLMEIDGFVVGCSSLMPFSKREARLRGWYMLPEYRGSGHGTKLAEVVMYEARSNGFEYLESKTRHRGIMEKLGFIFTGKEYPSWGGYRYVFPLVDNAKLPMEKAYES